MGHPSAVMEAVSADPIVGRDAQLGVLDASFTSALDGSVAAALAVGEAGFRDGFSGVRGPR